MIDDQQHFIIELPVAIVFPGKNVVLYAQKTSRYIIALAFTSSDIICRTHSTLSKEKIIRFSFFNRFILKLHQPINNQNPLNVTIQISLLFLGLKAFHVKNVIFIKYFILNLQKVVLDFYKLTVTSTSKLFFCNRVALHVELHVFIDFFFI